MNDNILGVFVQFLSNSYGKPTDYINENDRRIKYFNEYIWGTDGDGGLAAELKVLKRDYGPSLDLVLLQFRVFPMEVFVEKTALKERYRSKEKSIGLWIDISGDNFFSRSKDEQNRYVVSAIINGLREVEKKLQARKLTVDTQRLIADTESVLSHRGGAEYE